MKTKHTPGPWLECYCAARRLAEAVFYRNDKRNLGPKAREQAIKANTCLVAAAPELLEASIAAEKQLSALQRGSCPLCSEAGDGSPWGNKHAMSCALTILRAAINKATVGDQ
jgi:hypothetical protein